MDTNNVKKFVRALAAGDDASALSLLENGLVPIRAPCWPLEDGNVLPLILLAIVHERERVVRALVRLGANLDELRDCSKSADGLFLKTALGFAIDQGSSAMLALCHERGAEVSHVSCSDPRAHFPGTGIDNCIDSAKDLAIRAMHPACLVYVLDEVCPKPVHLGGNEMVSICATAMAPGRGNDAIAVYKIFTDRGYDFRKFEGVFFKNVNFGTTGSSASGEYVADSATGLEAPSELSFADLWLLNAQKSGDPILLAYLVKDLGLVSGIGKMGTLKCSLEASKIYVDSTEGLAKVFGVRPEASLARFECAACGSVGATKRCSGCKVTRYCSPECQDRHWKTGGHKKDCKKLSTGRVGPSNCAGPSQLNK